MSEDMKSEQPAADASGESVTLEGAAATRTGQDSQKRRPLVATMLIGLVGMILGAIVGVAVESAISATGLLGPGLDELIQEQIAGFDSINAKLEELRGTTDPEQVAVLTGELQSMLAAQEALVQRSHEELRGARQEIERLKQAALEAQGSAVGANLWLKPGEGATIVHAENVLSVIRAWPTRVRVNAAGEFIDLNVGDAAEFPDGDSVVKVFFKQAEARADGRLGFDVVRAGDS